MNPTDYLNRSALFRKLICGPYRELAGVYVAKMSSEGGATMHETLAEPVSGSDGLACRQWTLPCGWATKRWTLR